MELTITLITHSFIRVTIKREVQAPVRVAQRVRAKGVSGEIEITKSMDRGGGLGGSREISISTNVIFSPGQIWALVKYDSLTRGLPIKSVRAECAPTFPNVHAGIQGVVTSSHAMATGAKVVHRKHPHRSTSDPLVT